MNESRARYMCESWTRYMSNIAQLDLLDLCGTSLNIDYLDPIIAYQDPIIAHQDPIKAPEGVVYLCNIVIFVLSRNYL
jgi:hypothetical protein